MSIDKDIAQAFGLSVTPKVLQDIQDMEGFLTDESGKDYLNLLIASEYGRLIGRFYPEEMAKSLWENFKADFPTDETFSGSRLEFSDIRYLSTTRKLFEYAYSILAGHLSAALEDSLKDIFSEVVTRTLVDLNQKVIKLEDGNKVEELRERNIKANTRRIRDRLRVRRGKRIDKDAQDFWRTFRNAVNKVEASIRNGTVRKVTLESVAEEFDCSPRQLTEKCKKFCPPRSSDDRGHFKRTLGHLEKK